jgi:hypothetical protein
MLRRAVNHRVRRRLLDLRLHVRLRPVFRVFIAVSYILGAALPSDGAHLNRFPKAGAIVLNLRLAARKCYALSLEVPDLSARLAETSPRAGHGTGRLNGHTENTGDIGLAGRFSVRHGFPIQNDLPN